VRYACCVRGKIAIGRCAIKIESAAERCVGALLDLIKNKVNYVVQEAICVIKVWPIRLFKRRIKFFICLMAACADTFLSICRLNDGIQFHCD
jgi:vesicle coat complex subunit